MKGSLVSILIPTIVLVVAASIVGGSDLVLEGFTVSVNTAAQSSLMLLASFVLIGQLQVLITRELFSKALQRFSGIKGIIIGALAGGMFPGGPYIYFPCIDNFNRQGMPFYMFIAFIFGKNLYDFSRIPMESSLIHPSIALVRILITFPLPILVGLLARRLYENRTVQSIFTKVGEKHVSNHSDS